MNDRKRYSREEARRIIAKAMTSGRITPIPHFDEEMAKAKIARMDLENVARRGRVFREPEPDIKTGSWRYRIEGSDLDGHRLQVVFEILAQDWVRLITVFDGREDLQ